MHTVITQELYIQRAEITPDVENGFGIYFPEERMKYWSIFYLIR